MVAFNFRPQYADLVEKGKKRQTIRQKPRCKPGDVMQFYVGQRTKNCRKLGEGICTFVEMVEIDEHEIVIGHSEIYRKPIELDKLAVDDGFSDWEAFKEFFRKQYGLPFVGWVHCWKLKEQTT